MIAFFDAEKPVETLQPSLPIGCRSPKFKLNQGRIKEFMLNEGLPQGSCISALLFPIFINGIDLILKKLVSLFADDTSTWRIEKQHGMDKVINWTEKGEMQVNVDKTGIVVTFSARDDLSWDPQQMAAAKEIKAVQEYRFSRVKINNDLIFRSHVEKIV